MHGCKTADKGADFKVIGGFLTVQGVGIPNSFIVQGWTVLPCSCTKFTDGGRSLRYSSMH